MGCTTSKGASVRPARRPAECSESIISFVPVATPTTADEHAGVANLSFDGYAAPVTCRSREPLAMSISGIDPASGLGSLRLPQTRMHGRRRAHSQGFHSFAVGGAPCRERRTGGLPSRAVADVGINGPDLLVDENSPLGLRSPTATCNASPSSFYKPPTTALTAGSEQQSYYFMYAESSTGRGATRAPREVGSTATEENGEPEEGSLASSEDASSASRGTAEGPALLPDARSPGVVDAFIGCAPTRSGNGASSLRQDRDAVPTAHASMLSLERHGSASRLDRTNLMRHTRALASAGGAPLAPRVVPRSEADATDAHEEAVALALRESARLRESLVPARSISGCDGGGCVIRLSRITARGEGRDAANESSGEHRSDPIASSSSLVSPGVGQHTGVLVAVAPIAIAPVHFHYVNDDAFNPPSARPPATFAPLMSISRHISISDWLSQVAPSAGLEAEGGEQADDLGTLDSATVRTALARRQAVSFGDSCGAANDQCSDITYPVCGHGLSHSNRLLVSAADDSSSVAIPLTNPSCPNSANKRPVDF